MVDNRTYLAGIIFQGMVIADKNGLLVAAAESRQGAEHPVIQRATAAAVVLAKELAGKLESENVSGNDNCRQSGG